MDIGFPTKIFQSCTYQYKLFYDIKGGIWSFVKIIWFVIFSVSFATWEDIFLRKFILYKYANVIFYIIGISHSIKLFILNSLLLLPTYNLGMSIGKYYDLQERKQFCSSLKNVSASSNCIKECEYLGLSKAHQNY
jgi:hypothetical protein